MKAVIFTNVLYLILIKAFIVKGITKCESKVELRAVLLSCPTKDTGCEDDDLISQVMRSEESRILQANSRNFERLRAEKQRGFPNAVRDCKRKLVITLRIKNVGKIPCEDEYIVVDHVFDPVTGGRGRLLSPVVIKLRQEQMIQLYGLEFQRVVNSDPYEEKKTTSKPCSVNPENPTCGIAMYDGKPIPYSEGFCCSCDPHVNAKRQLPPASHGDPFFYRDSKLISQGNIRIVRDEKPPGVVEPGLAKFRSDKDGQDCGGIMDPINCDKIPNYFLENDRKILCDKHDFMNELCKLRKDKMEAQGVSKDTIQEASMNSINTGNMLETYPNRKTKFGENEMEVNPLEEASNTLTPSPDVPEEELKELKKFMKTFNEKDTMMSSFDGYPSKGSRGKRENRRENKKLSLEEKLERFVNTKKHLKNRRKRLLELSHRRFRKADDRKFGADGQDKTAYVSDDYVKSLPPRYFFFHDKAIIDPLESNSINASNLKMKEMRGLNVNHDIYHGPKQTKPDHGGNKLQNHYYHRPRGEAKLGKDKYMSRLGPKREKTTHDNMRRLESSLTKEDAKGKELKESDTNAFKEPGKDERIGDGEELIDEKVGLEEKKSQKSQFAGKNLKNFLHKSDSEKKQKAKIRNFFMARNREKQKYKPEQYKKVDLKQPEDYIEEKQKERPKEDNLNTVNTAKEFEEEQKKFDQEEREVENQIARTPEETPVLPLHPKTPIQTPPLQYPQIKPEQFDYDPIKYSTPDIIKDTAWYDNRLDQQEKKLQQDQEKKIPQIPQEQEEPSIKSNRKQTSKDIVGDVNFDLEIIRNRIPPENRQYAQPLDISVSPMKTNIYDMKGVPQYMKSKANAYNAHQQQKYYIVQKAQNFPQDFVMVQDGFEKAPKNRARLYKEKEVMNAPKDNSRGQANVYFYKKSPRHYHTPTEDEWMSGRPRQTFMPAPNEKLWEEQLRGKRYSDMSRKHRRFDIDEGRIWQLDPDHDTPQQQSDDSMRHRGKRSVSDFFNPARGFYRSEFDSEKSNEDIIHELDTCLPEENARKLDQDEWTSEFASWHFSRTKNDNYSIDENVFSSLQELESKLGFPSRRDKASKLESDKERLIQSYLNAPDYVLEEIESSMKGRRESQEDKEDKEEKEKEEAGKDTAHCMRFGDLWYSLYSIKKPVVAQMVGVQLFDKHSLCDGTTKWRDLTKGKMVRLGTFFTKAEDDIPTMSLTFFGEKVEGEKVKSIIDIDNYILLIPSHVSDPSKANLYPQFEGGPAEYLLVNSKDVSSGGECNMIGTSFEAFARQPDRCEQKMGSCLKRQPVDLWREDMKARIEGKKGKYFVENFGTVPNSPIKTYTNLTGEFLALEYYGEYTSTIEIEVKADSNAIVRKGSNAQIPLVYIDNTYPKKTRIVLSVLNIGLTSSLFRPRLGDCPPNLDPAWCPLEGPIVSIPPQQRHDFKLDLSGAPPFSQIYLSVQVLDEVNQPVASRKITIKKGERCVCAFHCRCNCMGNLDNGRTCRKLSQADYRKAGYLGPYPFRGGSATTASESILGKIHIVFITACYVLLFLGILKAILGLVFRQVGIAGTRVVTGPRALCSYYEYELKGCTVLYDDCGFPIHPTTCKPVQIVPMVVEFFINCFFFFVYPLRGLWFLLSALSICRVVCSDCDNACPQDESDNKCTRPLLGKQPSNPTCVHYNLTTVDTMKWKQACLPYPSYKGDDDPLEEDDTEYVLEEMKRYRKK